MSLSNQQLENLIKEIIKPATASNPRNIVVKQDSWMGSLFVELDADTILYVTPDWEDADQEICWEIYDESDNTEYANKHQYGKLEAKWTGHLAIDTFIYFTKVSELIAELKSNR